MITPKTAVSKLYIGIDIHKQSWKVHCAAHLFAGSPVPWNLMPYNSTLMCLLHNVAKKVVDLLYLTGLKVNIQIRILLQWDQRQKKRRTRFYHF